MTDIITRANAMLSDLQSGRTVERSRIVAVLSDLILDHADARRDVLLQAARIKALESELATLQASIVAAMSDAGPEVGEDERAG